MNTKIVVGLFVIVVLVFGGLYFVSQRALAQDPGPISIGGYCNNTLGIPGEPTPVQGIWKCADGSMVMYDLVCAAQYGPGYTAYSPNPQDPYSWGCIPLEQPAQPPAPPPPPVGETAASPANTGGATRLPMDIAGFCNQAIGQAGSPYVVGNTWYCSGGWFVTYELVCDWQFGLKYVAQSDDPGNAYAWGCGIGNRTEQVPVTGGSNPKVPPPAPLPDRALYAGSGAPPTSGDYVQMNASRVNIRAFPGTDQTILGVVQQYDYYPLYETRDGWGLISGSLGSGWVYLELASVSTGTTPTTTPVPAPASVPTSVPTEAPVINTPAPVVPTPASVGSTPTPPVAVPNPAPQLDLSPSCVAVESARLWSDIGGLELADCFESELASVPITTEQAYAFAAMAVSCGYAPMPEYIKAAGSYAVTHDAAASAVWISADSLANCWIDGQEFLESFFQ